MLRLCIALLMLPALAGPASASEENLWALINDYREGHGLQAIGLNEQLVAAAEWMSEDMAANDYCSHTDSLDRDFRERIADFGYLQKTGENLVCGAETAQEAFDLMVESPEHNTNMLYKYFYVGGAARAYDEGSTHRWYWTIAFGVWLPPPAVPATPIATPAPTPNGFPSTGRP